MNTAALVCFPVAAGFVRTESVGLQVLALLLMTIIAGVWLASGRFYRRGGHCRWLFNAELLFRRLGCRGGWRSHVERRDLLIGDRRAGRFVERDLSYIMCER